MSHTTPQSELQHLDRLLRLRLFVRSFATCTWALGLTTATLFLSLRLLGLQLSPTPLWLLALIVPLAWALWAVHGKTPDAARQADWLDRNRHLGGLLVTSREVELGPWRNRLDTALAESPRKDPQWQLGRPLAALLAPAVLWAVFLALPTPPAVKTPWESLQAHRLQRFEEKLDRLEETKALEEDEIQSLQERVRQLQEKLEKGESLDWEEVDSLDQILEQSKHERLVKLQEALNAAKNMAEALEASEQSRTIQPDLQAPALQELLERLEDAGLLADLPTKTFDGLQDDVLDSVGLELPEGLAEALGRVDSEGRPKTVGLPKDLEALQTLAQELGGVCESACEALAEEGLGAADLDDLDSLLEEYKAGLTKGGSTGGAKETEGVGKGGLDEGPGHAALDYVNETEGDRSALSIHKLPKGRRPSREWQSLGVSRGSPQVDPRRSTTSNAGQSDGTKASHRRRLSPHHREVVRRYFSEAKTLKSKSKSK